MGQIHAKEITSEERPTLDEEDPALHKHVFDGNNPVKVEHVHIDGLGRTKDDLVIRHMKDVLQAKTFKEVIQRTGEAKVKLEGLGVFKSVGVFIDTSKGDGSSAKGLDVTFNVKETRRLTGSAHTAVGNNEGSLVLGAKLPNTFGRAESLVAEYSRGTKHSSGFNVMLVKPIGQEFDKRLRGSVFKSSADYAPSSYRETGRGVTLDFTVLGAKLPNTFGRAESLVAEYSRGTKHSSGFNVMLVKPIGQEFDKRLRGSVFKSSADYAPSSYRETGRGVTLDFTFPSLVGMSELQWEGVWRELSCLTRTASFATREQSGHSLKSSLKHTLTRDTRAGALHLDTPLALIKVTTRAGKPSGQEPCISTPLSRSSKQGASPEEGFVDLEWICSFQNFTSLPCIRPPLGTLQEVLSGSLQGGVMKGLSESEVRLNDRFFVGGPTTVAGYTGGDVKFWKEQIQLQVNKSLFWNCVLSGSLQGGVMKGISDTEVRLNDRFFVGGPTTVRGFNIHGLGPHTQGDYQGGEAFWAGALHLYTPLPFIKAGRGGFGDVFRTHFFVNAGNLTTLDTNNMFAWEDHLQKLRQNFRWSYGAGLVLRIGSIARFELNYCMPQAAQATDSICQGLQFGIGVNFL
eukprot:XP_011670501.1 PREDICTED: sorting and assembly machinery component 50 homolog B [Strongylocentrotus purpuratus]